MTRLNASFLWQDVSQRNVFLMCFFCHPKQLFRKLVLPEGRNIYQQLHAMYQHISTFREHLHTSSGKK